ncbi:uncharacterized protein TRIADDRAFT_59410 [Trichoplax adhaerens]|uniref:Bicarbonate transporter-like transmembrane domain-containing protein n=1 Tax=Trichoplax adhaerens TaxID=10228 RepID=B3S500_TRIAD|nr:hypothetical protein TRIADDRAFT_59410 [Trichoplax adhaerens]EDV22178.1 hypothetical protein TRIADDRAFT_59410 [Trichoplax adhaerens]|eukprot:XP_002115333.1 hypothetical protein TRIADDRAFT_59410 [Trichoplax adhaerens]
MTNAVKIDIDPMLEFQKNYFGPGCNNSFASINVSAASDNLLESIGSLSLCRRDSSLVFLILMLGTVWLGIYLHNFRRSPLFDADKREFLSDYSLAISVLIFTLVKSFAFSEIRVEEFNFYNDTLITAPNMKSVTVANVFAAMGLGFPLSLLFFMDLNITSGIINSSTNNLKKGPAYHFDLLVLAFINLMLSIMGLPWVHGGLPHSPMHVRALAEVEQRVDQGRIHEKITRVRETRTAALLSHLLIALSFFLLLPIPIQMIPLGVLDGLFLYMSLIGTKNNQLFERIALLVTEQAAYPPAHYIRRVPQRKIHIFTITQVLQLAILCTVSFSPFKYLKLIFPIITFGLVPFRWFVVPKFVEKKYLEALDINLEKTTMQ